MKKKQKNLMFKMSVFMSDQDTAKLYVQFLDQNNPKSKY